MGAEILVDVDKLLKLTIDKDETVVGFCLVLNEAIEQLAIKEVGIGFAEPAEKLCNGPAVRPRPVGGLDPQGLVVHHGNAIADRKGMRVLLAVFTYGVVTQVNSKRLARIRVKMQRLVNNSVVVVEAFEDSGFTVLSPGQADAIGVA